MQTKPNKTKGGRAETQYKVYTVGGWYAKGRGVRDQVMFYADADAVSLREAQQVVRSLGLWQSDIEAA